MGLREFWNTKHPENTNEVQTWTWGDEIKHWGSMVLACMLFGVVIITYGLFFAV